jgi:hypothetical protein
VRAWALLHEAKVVAILGTLRLMGRLSPGLSHTLFASQALVVACARRSSEHLSPSHNLNAVEKHATTGAPKAEQLMAPQTLLVDFNRPRFLDDPLGRSVADRRLE